MDSNAHMEKAVSISIKDILGREFKFETLSSFQHFAEIEFNFWSAARDRLGNAGGLLGTVANTANNFKIAVERLTEWSSQLHSWDDHRVQTEYTTHIQPHFRKLPSIWIWSKHPVVDATLRCHESFGEISANAFLEYYLPGRTLTLQQGREGLRGLLMAYEFDMKDESSIPTRRASEEKSFEAMRGEITAIYDKIFNDSAKSSLELKSHVSDTKRQSEKLLKKSRRLLLKAVSTSERARTEQLNAWEAKIGDLQYSYEEKLRLEKPAQYWARSATKHGTLGFIWLGIFIAAVALGVSSVSDFFVAWLYGKQLPLSLNSLQGIALFGAIGAMFAFLLRTLARLALSSFHSMKDCHEREQLTYLYLALSKDAEIDKESRSIVLQALFSRSETGLLNNENGPTMPSVADAARVASRLPQ